MALDPKDFSAVVKVRAGKTYPDLVNSLALRTLTKEQATAEGWTTFFDSAPCAFGHVAAKFCKNSLCVDCWRQRNGRETIYPRAKDKKYYKQRDPAAATVNGAPAVAPSPSSEPTKGEEKLLAAIAEHRDIDKGCAAVGWTRAEFEARRASSDVFRKPAEDLIARLDIKQTRAPDAETYRWTPQIERQFTRRYVDCGLLEQTRQELGISASDYHTHLERSGAFARAISEAEPLARRTLRDRATQAAASGNDRLLKILEDEAPENPSNMSIEQAHAELSRMLDQLVKENVIPTVISRRRISTGEVIPAADLVVHEDTHSAAPDNSDLVGSP